MKRFSKFCRVFCLNVLASNSKWKILELELCFLFEIRIHILVKRIFLSHKFKQNEHDKGFLIPRKMLTRSTCFWNFQSAAMYKSIIVLC